MEKNIISQDNNSDNNNNNIENKNNKNEKEVSNKEANISETGTTQPNSFDFIAGIVTVITLLLLPVLIYFLVMSDVFDSPKPSSSNEREEKIYGTYHITEGLFANTDANPTLQISGDKTTFTMYGKGVTLYNKWTYDKDIVYIKNEYDETLFSCTQSKEDENKIKCDSYNKALGTGSYIWKK